MGLHVRVYDVHERGADVKETTAELIKGVEALCAYDAAQGLVHDLAGGFCSFVCPHRSACQDAECAGDAACIKYIEAHEVTT